MINCCLTIHTHDKWTSAVLKLYSFYSNEALRAVAGSKEYKAEMSPIVKFSSPAAHKHLEFSSRTICQTVIIQQEGETVRSTPI